MKTTRLLSVLLTLAILAGSVPYSYTYCMAMRRSIDSAMQLRCNARRGISQSSRAGMPALKPATPMMRFLSKSTTDSYEHCDDAVKGQAFTVLMRIDFPSIQPIGSGLSAPFQVEHPPPDLVIELLNLRI